MDLGIESDTDEVLRGIPGIKEKLDLNVELAKPSDFIPELPGWREPQVEAGNRHWVAPATMERTRCAPENAVSEPFGA